MLPGQLEGDTRGVERKGGKATLVFPMKRTFAGGSTRRAVTLKRVGFFCFPIKHSTHPPGGLEAKNGMSAAAPAPRMCEKKGALADG